MSKSYPIHLSPNDTYAMLIWIHGQQNSRLTNIHVIDEGGRKTTYDADDFLANFLEDGEGDEANTFVLESQLPRGKGVQYAGCRWDSGDDDLAWFGLSADSTREAMDNPPGTYVDWRKAYPDSPVHRKQL